MDKRVNAFPNKILPQIVYWGLVGLCLLTVISCSSTVKFSKHSTGGNTKPYSKADNSPNIKDKSVNLTARKVSKKIEAHKEPSASAEQPAINTSEIRNSILEKANGWLGVPYKWGGNSKNGVDCSGFIVQVFQEESYMLPRTAAAQFHYLKIVDTIDELEVGDLVFFSYNGTHINHVGILSGYGTMIHASSSRGVVEDSFLTGFFQGKFAGGGQIG